MSWGTEGEFERWFMKNPFLPNDVLRNGERVLVISRQRPIRRVVDLVALDGTSGLVIVEAKDSGPPAPRSANLSNTSLITTISVLRTLRTSTRY